MAENDNFDFLRDGKALRDMREFQNMIITSRDQVKKLGGEFKKATGESDDLKNRGEEIAKVYTSINTQLRGFADLQSKVFTSNKSLVTITNQRIKQENKLFQLRSESTKATQEFLKTQKKVRDLDSEILDLRDDIATLSGKERTKAQNDLKVKKSLLKEQQKQLEIQEKYAESLVEGVDTTGKVVDKYKELETFAESVNEKVGFFNGMAAFVKDIPGLGAISKPFQDAATAARKSQIHYEKIQGINIETGEGLKKDKIIELGLADQLLDKNGNILEGTAAVARIRKLGLEDAFKGMTGLQAGTKSLGAAMKKAVAPLAIIAVVGKALTAVLKLLVTSTIQSQERTTLLAREFGVSRDRAAQMRKELVESEKASNRMYISVTRLLEAQTMLVNQLERGGTFNFQNLDTILLLTKRMGVTDDVATKIAARAEAFGVNSRANIDAIMMMNNELFNSGESTATIGQLMTSVSEATGQVAASLGFSNTNIARAVNQVRRFGLNLLQARNISENLLDFEKSLNAELEAELFLGRDINLDKARMMSLQGDIVGATEEVMKITRGLTAEQRKSPIVMGALADIIGISVDELQDAYLLETDRARQGQQQLENYQKYIQLVKQQQALEKRFTEAISRLEEKRSKLNEKENKKEIKVLDDEIAKMRENMAQNKEYLEQQKKRLNIAEETADELAANVTAQEAFNETVQKLKDRLMEFTTSSIFDKVLERLRLFAEYGVKGLSMELGQNYQVRTKDQIIFEELGQQSRREFLNYQLESKKLQNIVENGTEEEKANAQESLKQLKGNHKELIESVNNLADFEASKLLNISNVFDRAGKIDQGEFTKSLAIAQMKNLEEEFLEQVQLMSDSFTDAAKTNTMSRTWSYSSGPRPTVTSVSDNQSIIDSALNPQDQDNTLQGLISPESGEVEKNNDFIIRPGQPIQKFRKDDIVIGGTNLFGGGSSKNVEKKLDAILAAIQAGGNVYIDGNKAGRAIVLATQKLS